MPTRNQKSAPDCAEIRVIARLEHTAPDRGSEGRTGGLAGSRYAHIVPPPTS